MNEAIIERHNSIVAPNDDVYVLGDLMLGDNEKGMECLRRLHGRLHIILGNHCTPTREAMYKVLPNVVEVAWALKLDYRKYHFFLSHFPSMTGNLGAESLHKVTCNLFGHTHSKEKFYNDIPFMYNVAVDAHDCYPVCLDEIITDMNEKVEECISFL